MDNRENLLVCAMQLFAERGYEATGIQEIVNTAGVTKPTLYHYFGSKQGLLAALLEENFQPLKNTLQQAAFYRHDLKMNLRGLAEAYLQFANQNPTFYRLQLALWFTPQGSETHQIIEKINQRQYQILEDLFRQAAEDHGNMRNRHQTLALSFIGMVNTYIALWLKEKRMPDDGWIDRLVHQFEHGIYS